MDRRQFLRLAALGSTTALLAACEAFTPVVPTPTARSISQTRPTAVPFQAGSGPVALRVVTSLFSYEGGQQAFESLLAGYRGAHPDVTVEVEYLPDSRAVADRVRGGLTDGNPPDVFTIDSPWLAGFAASNDLLNIEFQVRAGELGDFILALQQNASWGGHLYALPLRASTSVLLYRKDHFAEAGLDPEKPPRSWEELADAAVRLTRRNPDGTLTRAGFDLAGGATSAADQPRQHFLPFFWQAGAQLFSGPNTAPTPAFNSTEAVEALDWWLGLVRDKRVTDTGPLPGPAILSGKAAMGSYPETVWRAAQAQPDLLAQLGSLPSLQRKETGEFASGELIAVSRATRYASEAWALVQYLTAPDTMVRVDAALSALPARKSLVVTDYVKASPVLTAASRHLAIARAEGGPVRWPAIRDLWDQTLIDALRAPRPAREILDALNQHAADILKA